MPFTVDTCLVCSGDEPSEDQDNNRSADRLRRTLRVTAIALTLWGCLNTILPAPDGISSFFFQRDVVWLAMAVALLAALSLWPARLSIKASWIAAMCGRRRAEVALVFVATGLVLIGTHVMYHGYALSRDEAMARFDAIILYHGQLLAHVPSAWRAFANALEPTFVLPVPGHAAWVSTYLPGNAAIRAILDVPFGIPLANPFLVTLTILTTFGVARQIWPDRRDAAVIAGALLVTSTQLIVTAFTPYAMTAHLALNMLWLWLHLRGRFWCHVGAIAMGAIACGLHQIVFHPLFVAPFILQLWLGRRWWLATVYTASYAAIGVFWIMYWKILMTRYGFQEAGRAHGIAAFYDQVAGLISAFNWSGIELMGQNITRFMAWQNPFVIPLVFVALVSLRRFEGPVAALAAGIALTLVAMFVLLPYQGLGWGYRYVHGLLGAFALLGAQGWILTTSPAGKGANRLWAQFGVASAFSMFVMLPARALEVEALVKPFVLASRAIGAAPTDIVILDPNGMSFSEDLVRNDPFLRNRPLVMNLNELDAAGLRTLCANNTIAIFDRHDGTVFHLPERNRREENPLRLLMTESSCGHHLVADAP